MIFVIQGAIYLSLLLYHGRQLIKVESVTPWRRVGKMLMLLSAVHTNYSTKQKYNKETNINIIKQKTMVNYRLY